MRGFAAPRRPISLGAALLAASALVWLGAGCGQSPLGLKPGLTAGATVVVTAATSTTAPPTATTQPPTSATASDGTATATAGGVTLDYPTAWLARPNGDTGLVIATTEADLAATHPLGPRFVVDASTTDAATSGAADMTGVLQEVIGNSTDPTAAAAAAASIAVVADPQEIQIGGQKAVLVILQNGTGGQSTISCYVVVTLAGGTPVLLTLEAPADLWESAHPGLETILSSVRFQ